MDIDVKLEGNAVKGLAELQRRSEDLAPLMLDISEIMQDSVEESFQGQADPETGQPWQKLSPVTLALREKRGQPLNNILRVSGQLVSSIQSLAGSDFAQVGTNTAYARIQNLGGFAGRNRKVEIPQRRYMGLWPEHRSKIDGTVQRYLLQGHQ